jgi:hypothetical protein
VGRFTASKKLPYLSPAHAGSFGGTYQPPAEAAMAQLKLKVEASPAVIQSEVGGWE